MKLKITHTTQYDFETPVTFGLQQVRATPKSFRNQKVESWDTIIEGGRKELSFEDYHRNLVELISFETGTVHVTLTSTGEVEIDDTQGVLGPHEGCTPLWLFLRQTALTKPGKGIREILQAVKADQPLERLHALMAQIQERIEYEVGVSDPDWTAEDAIEAGNGVCQDHAHVFVSAARQMNIPARYVSGYLLMDDREHQTATHAWAEAYVEGLGWVGFDVSNGISPDGRYVRVATGLDYAQAAPVIGMRMGEGGEKLSVQLQIAQQ